MLTERHKEIAGKIWEIAEEQPRLFFMHFWANGVPTAVATGLRNALNATAVRQR